MERCNIEKGRVTISDDLSIVVKYYNGLYLYSKMGETSVEIADEEVSALLEFLETYLKTKFGI